MKKMKMLSLGLLFSFALLFTACKKSSTNDSTENTTESQVHSEDQSMVADQVDESANDATTMTENVIAMTGRTPVPWFPNPCNSTITYDTMNAIRTMTITYNGLNCNGTRTRTGVITISIPSGVLWKNAGAQLTINFINLKITRVSNGKSITINGTKVVTNVSGGLIREVATMGPVTHTITSSNMSITFDNASQRTWSIAKRRVFSYNNGLVITTTGTYSDGATTGISEWGTNRFGNSFITQIVDPMIIRQDCAFRLTSGHIKHTKLIRTVDVTFGLDSAGNPTTCPGAGSYYMKISWVNANNVTVVVILPY